MARKNPATNPRVDVSRRKFLAGAAVAGAAVSAAQTPARAAPPPVGAAKVPSAVRPTPRQIAAETEMPKELAASHGRPGSDFMVDVIKSLKIEYVYSNPASSFRGLHETLINYGKTSMPEFITCMHEESAVAMAHGYFKASGKMQMVLCHGTVGLQHATMAIYNAWVDRVPVLVIGGNDLDAAHRPPGVPTIHSAQDINAIVRDFTKWDDTPVSLQHFAQSFVRAYKMAMTPPYEPVAISLDAALADVPANSDPHLYIPRYVPSMPPQAELAALKETARLLVNAERPVIVAERLVRTEKGFADIVVLAELLQAPVVNRRGRLNVPNTHHLAGSPALLRTADVVLGLEVSDFWAVVNHFVDNGEEHGHGLRERVVKPDAKLITISAAELNQKSNYQDFQRFQAVDISMLGDAEASLPALIDAVKSLLTSEKKAAFAKRGEAFKKAKAKAHERSRQAAALSWNATPITTARLCAELGAQIKDLDWSMATFPNGISGWPNRLWAMDRYYRHFGHSGGSGLGYALPASIGVAHANRELGRFTVNIQSDGDMMYAPGAFWTAARHQIPLLSVVHNNHGYHQEVMHVQRLSNRRNRVANLGKDLGPIGTRIENPDIDYARLASSMGWWSAGPITDPAELGSTLKKAVEVVKSGQPALVDVVSQPR
jgi:thiamine pyrophosphate-dependent acetolactate synthase large subunit-like protein